MTKKSKGAILFGVFYQSLYNIHTQNEIVMKASIISSQDVG